MKLNLRSLLSDLQIITKSTCGYERTQRHYVLSYFSSGSLREQGWCIILPLLSIQNVWWLNVLKMQFSPTTLSSCLKPASVNRIKFYLQQWYQCTAYLSLHCSLCCTDTSVCVAASWTVAGKSGWKDLWWENKTEAWREIHHLAAQRGHFPDSVCRNVPSATPAQLREWSSVARASTRNCVAVVTFPQYW